MKKQKRGWTLSLLLSMLICCCLGCGWKMPQEIRKDMEKASEKLEELLYYNELDLREEVTIEGEQIVFTVYENQAIPYRWKIEIDGEALQIVEEETVYGEGGLQNGDSPAYHVFTLQWQKDGEAKIELIHARYGSDDRSEANVIRSFAALKKGKQILCVEE